MDRFPFPSVKPPITINSSNFCVSGVLVACFKILLVVLLSLIFASFGSPILAMFIMGETLILLARVLTGNGPSNYEFATVKVVAAASRYLE